MEREDGDGEARGGWVLRWVAGALAVLALLLVVLWTQRAPIAENFITRELNGLGVRARYDIDSIGVRTQRIENIVLGDPARPDLTARWVEVDLSVAGLTPGVAAVRAGGVRIFGRIRDGQLWLGELDRFRDPDSTAPFSLPDILLGLTDARMRLATDAGPIGLKIDGSGNLRSGFQGKLAAVMPTAAMSGCTVTRATAYVDIAMRDGRPRIAGPIRGRGIGCPDMGIALASPVLDADLTLSQALDRWQGRATLSGEGLRAPGMVLASPVVRTSFDGTAAGTRGHATLAAKALTAGAMLAGATEIAGGWSVASGERGLTAQADGALTARTVQLSGTDPLGGLRSSTAATPLGPLAAKLADAIRDAGKANVLRARFAAAQRGRGGGVVLSSADFSSGSGARAGLSPGSRFTLSWPAVGKGPLPWRLDGGMTMQGGGLPKAALRLAQRPGGGLSGQLFADPYTAPGARLVLDPVRFTAGRQGETRFTTALALDGPLDGGALRGLTLPVEGVIGADGAIAINRACTPLGFTSLDYAGFAFGRNRFNLCPTEGGALLAYGPRGLTGGLQLKALRLEGRMGSAPMRLSASALRFTLADSGFVMRDADLAIGSQDSPIRLTATSLVGAAAGEGLGGTLAGTTGRIGAVPLLVVDANGRWGFAKGALKVAASLTLQDAQQPDRFNPLVSRDFVLTHTANRITAQGTLLEPRTSALVTRADIVHDLGTGRGRADLDVPGIAFRDDLQPEDITRLALGVVANARGVVSGRGQVRWNGDDVTSDGLFRTDNMNLAAAFGPVAGLSGELRFTDLIGLVSAPGQIVRLANVNPGIEVTDGVVHYQLLANQQVRIEDGEWPFAGGRLTLLPTTMDFSADKARSLTFRVLGLDAGAFINTLDLDNVSATGTFDGLLPMIFDATGGRIVGGVLVARQIGLPPLVLAGSEKLNIPCDPARQAGTLAYVGPVSNEDVGMMGKLAFDALKNLQYKCLVILMDGAIDGEVVTQVLFNGVNRGQIGDAPAAIARQFIGLPFIFNVRIEAPFRGLMNTAQSFVDPTGLIRNSLGEDYMQKLEQGVAVQPAESETMRSGEQ